jgi:hypothetical protein
MNILVTSHIPFPIESVFLAMRDNLPELVQFMPNIHSIEILNRETTISGDISMLNKWNSATEIPKVVRSFIPQDKTYWLDSAVWSTEQKAADWSLEMGFMPERVTCTGTTSFHMLGPQSTEMRAQGTLELNLKGLVPRLLLRRSTSAVERFVRVLVQPNFEKTSDALIAYLKGLES